MKSHLASPGRFSIQACALGFVFLALMALNPAQAWARRDYGAHAGYVSDTEGERSAVASDIIVIQPPPAEGPPLTQRIFNDNLMKEFRDRYDEKFGRTEVDRVYNSPNRFTYYDDLYGFKGTQQEYNDERRSYADFVMKRLLEYHVDHYAQSEPKLRAAWEAKEKIKEFKAEIGGFRFDAQYSIAGNTFDVKMNNPYLNLTRVRLQMGGSFGPGPIEEMIVSLGRNITQTTFVEGHWAMTDGITTFIGRKALSPVIASTVTVSTFTLEHGKSLRESRYLGGVSYVF